MHLLTYHTVDIFETGLSNLVEGRGIANRLSVCVDNEGVYTVDAFQSDKGACFPVEV